MVMKKYPIKKNACIVVDGFPMRIRGAQLKNIMFKGAVQLVVDGNSYKIIKKIEKYLEKNYLNEVSEEFDGFSNNDLYLIYEILVDKLSETVYNKRPSNQYKILDNNREIFEELETFEKAKVINEIITMLRCDASTTADLKLVGGPSTAGGLTVNKNTVGASCLVLINQSVTGLYEEREVLE